MTNFSGKPIRIGLIGVGARLRHVVRRLVNEAPKDTIKIVTAYDPDPGSLAALNKQDHGGHSREPDRPDMAPVHQEFTDKIEEAASEEAVARHPNVDWVFIGSPNSLHARQSILALEAGKNVFCEKPLATNLKDCLAIRNAVQKSGRTFAFGLVLRYSPHYRKIQELVASKKIGDLISFEFNETLGADHGGYIFGNWRRKVENAGTHLLEKCCHDLDLANWIIGSLPVAVASFGGKDFFTPKNAHQVQRIGNNAKGFPAYSTWVDPHRVDPFSEGADIVDNQVAILQYANGVRATFHTNCNTAIPERRMYLCGTEGTLRADVYTRNIELQRIGYDIKQEDLKAVPIAHDSMAGHAGADGAMARSLVKTLLHGEPPLATVEDGIRSCIVAFAIDQAMNEGKVVHLEPLWSAAGIQVSAPTVSTPN